MGREMESRNAIYDLFIACNEYSTEQARGEQNFDVQFIWNVVNLLG